MERHLVRMHHMQPGFFYRLHDSQHNDRGYNRHRIAYYSARFEREARAQKEQTALEKFMEDA